MGAKTDRIRELEAQLAQRDEDLRGATARAALAGDELERAQQTARDVSAIADQLGAELAAAKASAAAALEAHRAELETVTDAHRVARDELGGHVATAREERDQAKRRTAEIEAVLEELREPLKRRGVVLEDEHDPILLARRAAAELELKHGAPREALEKELRTLRARVAELEEKGADIP